MRIGLLSYRSKPHCGGQGVYVRYLSRGLVELGHQVEVFSGQPYPEELDPRVKLTKVPSLDLFGGPDFPRRIRRRDLRDRYDVLEYLTTKTGTFAEPLAFSYRVARLMRTRAADFDVVHDNQSLGYGLLSLKRRGIPLVATLHHPISRDRRVELSAAPLRKKYGISRWYGFVRMQARVARRLPMLIGVSDVASADAVADFKLPPGRFRVVPLGVDVDVFRPAAERVPGRIVAVASADRPLKGVAYLLDAIAKLRVDHPVELQLVSALEPGGATERRIAELGLTDCVTVRTGLSDAELAALLGSAEIMCVPSLYEGFSLPTVEGLSCGTPIVASRAGALPEVIGDAGVLVEPGDAGALVTAIDALLRSPAERARLGAAGRARAEERYSWISVARATVTAYADAMSAVKGA
ncbi:glycosyltransferase family 4 protein [Cryptosporangium sp. NPDC051539]|uniref:glycosyltransferase family 4 protein n=1 Tax=Cryptosporangium sp. NPDC051539 TaxID=3363962 RepID=UPI0037887CFB